MSDHWGGGKESLFPGLSVEAKGVGVERSMEMLRYPTRFHSWIGYPTGGCRTTPIRKEGFTVSQVGSGLTVSRV